MTTSPSLRYADLPARERILRTAHDLFYRDGIRATGIDRVIAESGVTKVTFYRHFPSKNELIRAYLDDRHERWMAWFKAALQRHGAGGLAALPPALAEWLDEETYRGCAFINAAVELGGSQPALLDIVKRHKQEMTAEIETLLPDNERRTQIARLAAMAIDGAIVQAQFEASPERALANLRLLVESLV
ncbi:TetR/AcrR family transcriptional regulator [Paludibacterium purpuratum]|nr:TetR/AcrR family transcriptional regulator [Paludibacterium purpuratum]